jgi:hypothetical protein
MMPQYVTVNEFKSAPTGIDCSTLDQMNIGNQFAQDIALQDVLRRASAWVDNYCKMTLQATINTETKEVHATRNGRLNVHPNNIPIINLQQVGFKTAPNLGFTVQDMSSVQVFERYFSIYYLQTGFFAPSLAVQYPEFGYYNPFQKQQLADMPIIVNYTYINGYANALLSQDVPDGSTTIVVDNPVGFLPGTQFTLYDSFEENCTVASVSGNTITLTAPTLAYHSTGINASTLPADVKQATILFASVLIRERGAVSITMNGTAVQGVNSNFVKFDDVSIAQSLLKPYRRVITS